MIQKGDTPDRMRKHALPVVLIIVVAAGVFVNALRSEFIWDDYAVIAHNDHIRDLHDPLRFFGLDYWLTLYDEDRGLRGRAYRPLVELSFAVEYAIWEYNQIGWHITSVTWHAVNCVLLYFLMLGVLRDKVLATFCALLFAAHPIHVEAVVWAKARSELLAFMLMLVSTLLYLRFVAPAPPARRRTWVYLLSLLAFALALLSKASSLVLPALLVLYVWCFLPRNGLRGALIAIGPFAGLAGGFLALDSMIPGMALTIYWSTWSYQHLLAILGTIARYLGLFVAPVELWGGEHPVWNFVHRLFPGHVGLCLHQPYPRVESLWAPEPLTGLVLLVILLGATVFALLRSRLTFFALGWLLIGLAPISNLKLLPRLIGEGRAYIASVGFCLLVTLLLGRIRSIRRLPLPWLTPARLAIGLCAVIVMVYSGLTVRRNMDWRDNYTLWTDTVAKNPHAIDAHRHLATHYMDAGQRYKAIPHLQAASTIVPEYPRAVRQLAKICADQGLLIEAIRLYELVLQYEPDNVEARLGLSTVYLTKNRLVEALDQLKAALQYDPESAEAHQKMGYVYVLQERFDEAVAAFRRAADLGGDVAATHHALGTVYSRTDRHEAAIKEYLAAVRAEPERMQTWAALGESYESLGKTEDALAAYRRCLGFSGPLDDFARAGIERLAPGDPDGLGGGASAD